jgi:DNA-3-methyladenine glycosylase II
MATPEFQKARRHLSRRDAVLKRLIRAIGPCTLRTNDDHFAILARSIISQQISTKAALAIGARVLKVLGRRGLRPKSLLEADAQALRQAGLSANKLLSLRDLATKCASGEVPLRKLSDLDDEAVIESLIPVRGIGRWTAEMFLIFSLGRLDVLPVGDYGLRAGVAKQYALADLPDKAALTELAAPWQPYRSVGTWFIWRSFGNVPQSDA